MAIFGSGDEKRLKYLEEEREKLWGRITSLENLVSELKELISKKTTDYEKEARQASKKTSEFRNRTEEAKNKAHEYIESLEKIVNEANDFNNNFAEYKTQIQDTINSSNENGKIIADSSKQAIDNLQTIEERIGRLNEIFEDNNDLSSKMEELQGIFDEIQDIHNKVKVPYKDILQKKQDINAVYYEIMGYDEEPDEEGHESHVDGLREKLEKTFEGLKDKLEEFNDKIEEHKKEKTGDYEKIKSTWENVFIEIRGKIESLLPQAMTAGLSSAYSDKRINEIEES